MQFLSILHIICVIIFSNGYRNHSAQTKASESSSKEILVFAQYRVESPDWETTIKNRIDSSKPSLQGRLIPAESQDGLFSSGKLSLAVQLRTIEWQTPQFLSGLPNPLDTWSSSFERTQISQAHRGERPMELELSGQEAAEERKAEREGSKRKPTKGQQRAGQRTQRQRQRAWWCRLARWHTAPCNPTLAISRSQCQCSPSTHSADTVHCICVQCRMADSHSEGISGYHTSSGGHPESSRKSGKSIIQGPLQRPEQSLQPSGQGSETADQHPRSQSLTPAELAQASQGLCLELAEAAPGLQRPTERVRRADVKGPNGAHISEKTLAEPQQAGSSHWNTCDHRDRGISSGTYRHGGVSCLRTGGTSLGSAGARESSTEHCSGIQGQRHHGDSFGRRRRQAVKTSSIHGTVWWSGRWSRWCSYFFTQIMIFGSDVACPYSVNVPRVPLFNFEATENVEAYCNHDGSNAACTPDLTAHTIQSMIRCHSIHWDPSFVSEPTAIGRAMLLRAEVLSAADSSLTPLQGKTQILASPSILKRDAGRMQTTKTVQFQPFVNVIESYYTPHVEPLQEDDADFVSLMARQPRPRNLPSSSGGETDSDFETHEPSSPSSFPEDALWRSIQIYDLRSNYGRGRIQVRPPEAAFAEARRLLGYTHHEVAEIFEITPPPDDLDAVHVQPLLLVQHDDIQFGDDRRAVLMEVQLHGPHFDSTVEIDRYTTLLPSPIHRSALLRFAGVAQYCHVSLDRCLLWHRGQLIPFQAMYTLALNHGDYIKIAVPPFHDESVPTYFAVRACQYGLAADEIAIRHQQNPNPHDFFTDNEAAQELSEGDELIGLQISCDTAVPFQSDLRRCDHHEVPAPAFTCTSPETFLPHRQQPAFDPPRQSWFNALQTTFAERAETACDEEGPIAFIVTWYVSGSSEQCNEESRTMQLDQHTHLWYQDLIHLWRDKIDFASPVHCHFVQPEPPRHDTSWNIGHLIISQRVERPFSAVLLTIRFLTDHRTGLNYAAAVLESPTTAFGIRDTCNLARICMDRHFDVQIGHHHFVQTDEIAVQHGDGLIFNIHPPVHTFHIGDDQVIEPQWIPISATPAQDEDAVMMPDITDQSAFTQELFDYWDVHARTGPAHMERLLHVTTWCLHAERIRFNDETRTVTLGDDFYAWESLLQRAWQDLLDPLIAVDFAIVDDQPAGFPGAHGLHIIVHQQLRRDERATIVTVFNDYLRSAPHVAAVILPHVVGQTALVRAVHKEDECPPRNPHTVCNTWQVGWQFNDAAPYRCQHGQTFMLIILPKFFDFWQDDLVEERDTEASSSTNLLQYKVQVTRSMQDFEESHVGDRRLTTGQVAHTQWPDRPTICLDDLVQSSPTVRVDLSPVFRLLDELKSIAFNFTQPWPVDLPVPEVTEHALNALTPIGTCTPYGYHFFTDGSKAPDGNIGSAVLLLIESDTGWHYGGCVYKNVITGGTSIAGENGAIIWALLWALHISDETYTLHGRADIFFTMNFDATSAGFVAAGYWSSTLMPSWRTTMRSLAQLITTRHGFDQLIWNHVKAHDGHPWNEGADALAKYAARHHRGCDDSHFWENWLHNDSKQVALQWLWYVELMQVADPRVPLLRDEQMVCFMDNRAQSREVTPKMASCDVPDEAPPMCTFDITIATANVLTLANEHSHASSISRQFVLMQQLAEANCIIVGVQETRHQHVTGTNNEYYHIYGHRATKTGQDGVQLWLSKQIPVWPNGPVISAKDVRIVASAPNFIVAKVKLSFWKCIIFTGRAPHSGRPQAEAHAFWNHVAQILQKQGAGLPVFFCGDANAHLGEFVTSAVGPLQPDAENQAGHVFHNWLLKHNMFVPATFPEHHVGSEHSTFVAPGGDCEKRIDYIALPHSVCFTKIQSKVELDIDVNNRRQDHKAVTCRITFQAQSPQRGGKRARKYRPDVSDIRFKLQHHAWLSHLHHATVAPPWSMDPHASAEWLAASATDAMQAIAKPLKLWKRKSHISQATWQLVEQKKFLYKQLRALKRAELFTMLQACFRGWHLAAQQDSLLPHSVLQAHRHLVQDLPSWCKLHDVSTAQTLREYQLAEGRVHQAIKAEDASFYSALADRAARTYHVEGLHGIWKQIKALQPKHRAKRSHQHRDIDDELLKHFEQLEAGTSKGFALLKQECVQRAQLEQQDCPECLHLPLQELPTLAEVESLCLAQKARKAAGPDGIPPDLCRYGAVAISQQLHSLICKSFLQGIEPVTFKGGTLCPIFKGKSHLDDAAGYRGIILADSFAKITHAWTRKRLLPTLQQRKTIGQLGGLPAQQTVTGVQIVRLHSIVGHSKGLSTATLFIDLRSAFHHMLRELIFATKNHLLQDTLASMLDADDFDIERLHQRLDELCSASINDIPTGLRRFLHDIHQHTWFCLQGSLQQETGECSHPLRGTRPGSPLADIGFNLLMTDLLKDIQTGLMEEDAFRTGADALGTYVPPIAWMDDVAISLATVSARQLVPLAKSTIAAAHRAFQQRGLSMNLDAGKTELVVMFRGEGAVHCRSEMFDRGDAPQVVVTTDSHIISVRVAASYRHLGVRFAMNLDFDTEVSARLGAARQAFEQMKKAIFLNPAIPVPCRISLFQSLILSRLLYGCAIWAELSNASFRKLESMVIGYYRQIYGVGYWSEERVTDLDFLQGQELQPFRIHLARHRLCYLQNVAKHGITAHKTLLLAEFSTGRGWLHEVAQDLQWMGTLQDLPFDNPVDRPHWIQVWQALRECQQWKGWIKRSIRKHTTQEKIAYDIRIYHQSIVQELEHFGADVDRNEEPPSAPEQTLRCDHCPAQFATGQQLALHAFRLHGLRANECHYVQSDVCPGCLKTFHTSFRVSQHLRYRPNQCWERIYGVRKPDTPVHIGLPDHLRGVHRLPAARKHHGPLRPTAHHRERQRVRQAILALQAEGEPDFAWWDPCADQLLTQRCIRQFEQCLDDWFGEEEPNEEHFHNLFFNLFHQMGVPEFQAARIFIHWVETDFHAYCAKFTDFDALEVLEVAHMSLLEDTYIWVLQRRMRELCRQWERLQQGEPRRARPVSLAPLPRKPRLHSIRMDYHGMAADELRRRAWRIAGRPKLKPLPTLCKVHISSFISMRDVGELMIFMRRCKHWLQRARPLGVRRFLSSPLTRQSMTPWMCTAIASGTFSLQQHVQAAS